MALEAHALQLKNTYIDKSLFCEVYLVVLSVCDVFGCVFCSCPEFLHLDVLSLCSIFSKSCIFIVKMLKHFSICMC